MRNTVLILLMFAVPLIATNAPKKAKIKSIDRKANSLVLELMESLVGSTGRDLCLIPSGVHHDEGTKCGRVVGRLTRDRLVISMSSDVSIFGEEEIVALLFTNAQPTAKRVPAMTTSISVEPPPASSNISAGLTFGTNYFFPELHFEYAIGQRFTLGLMAVIGDSGSGTLHHRALGGFLTQSYFFPAPLLGFNLRLMEGMYRFENTVLVQSEVFNAAVFSFGAGWRGYFSDSLNFGLTAGLQYVGSSFDSSFLDFSGVQPVFIIEVGYSF